MLNAWKAPWRLAAPLFLSLGLVACPAPPGGEADAGVDAGAPSDAGTDAGADAGVACFLDDGGVAPSCTFTLAWDTAAEAFPTPRDHHASFVVDLGPGRRFLYVAGGYNQTLQQLFTDVTAAPIADDGSLGAWAPGRALPVATSGMAVAQTATHVYLVGGFGSTRVWSSRFDATGALGPWVAGPALPAARFHGAALAHGGRLYVVGGINGSSTTDVVLSAALDLDGQPTAWVTAGQLPYTLSHAGLAVVGDRLLVLGGQTGNVNTSAGLDRPDVLVTTISPDGSLGAFTASTPMPEARTTHAATVVGDTVYVLAGIANTTAQQANGRPTNGVLVGKVGAADITWSQGTALPAARAHVHHAPRFRDTLYLVSGVNEVHLDTTTVFVGALQP